MTSEFSADPIPTIVAVGAAVFAMASAIAAFRSLRLVRHTNAVPVLTEMFKEHRGKHLADVRAYVRSIPAEHDFTGGLASLPRKMRDPVRDLLWFYDNLGVLVVHRVIDVEVISGYLGGSATSTWKMLSPLIREERKRRKLDGDTDADRWQEYFQLLVEAVAAHPPSTSRDRAARWIRAGS